MTLCWSVNRARLDQAHLYSLLEVVTVARWRIFSLSHGWHCVPLRGIQRLYKVQSVCAASRPQHMQEQTRLLPPLQQQNHVDMDLVRQMWLFHKAARPPGKYSSALTSLDMNARLDLVTFRVLTRTAVSWHPPQCHICHPWPPLLTLTTLVFSSYPLFSLVPLTFGP